MAMACSKLSDDSLQLVGGHARRGVAGTDAAAGGSGPAALQ